MRSGLPRNIIGLYCDLLFTCLVFVSVKPWKQTHVREEGIARCFLIYVVCILYVCVFIPIRSWRQEQKFGPRRQLQHPILSILQHIFSKKFVVPCRLKGFDQNGFILKNGCGGYLHCKHASPSSWKIALTTHTVMNLDNGTWNLMISPNHSSGQ